MDFSAKHIAFVVASYGLSFAVLGWLIVTTLLRDRRLRAEAARLDTRRGSPRQ